MVKVANTTGSATKKPAEKTASAVVEKPVEGDEAVVETGEAIEQSASEKKDGEKKTDGKSKISFVTPAKVKGLKGSIPEPGKRRLKCMVYGEAGSGKTWFATGMPAPYVIDCERGAEQPAYINRIRENGGSYLPTLDFDEIIQEVRQLATVRHPFKTLVIDPITPVYDAVLDTGEAEVGTKYGRHHGFMGKRFKRLYGLLLGLDMNVIVTAHGKNLYKEGGMEVVGQTFDGWKKFIYLFDLSLELKIAGERHIAWVRKTRVAEFKQHESFDWSLEEFARRYGSDLTRDSALIEFATPEQVARMKRLVTLLQMSEATITRLFTKYGVGSFEDMPRDVIDKCIAFYDTKLKREME